MEASQLKNGKLRERKIMRLSEAGWNGKGEGGERVTGSEQEKGREGGIKGKSRNRNTGMQENKEVPPNSRNFGEE